MILDALLDPAVTIDRQGKILWVNTAWSDFARSNGASLQLCAGAGSNYFDACRASADGARVMAGLQAILNGAAGKFEFEYPCHAPDCPRWFRLQATPLDERCSGLLLVHIDITRRRQAEIALRKR